MKSLRVGAVAVALALLAVSLLIWKPWDSCAAPNDICDFAAATAKHDGVLDYQVSAGVADQDALAEPDLSVELQFALSAQLDPTQAGALAKQIAQKIQAQAAELRWMRTELSFVAGRAEEMQGLDQESYPLQVVETFARDISSEREKPSQLGEATTYAFNLYRLGAGKVTNYSATANSLEQFLVLGKFAAQQQSHTALALNGPLVSYSPSQRIDYAEIEFLVAAAQRQHLEQVRIDNSGLSLTVGDAAPAGREQEIQHWLENHDPFNEPLSYQLFTQNFGEILEGWVGGKKPEWLVPKPVTLPEKVKAWPKNPTAAMCADDDLEILLGAPDAAAGSRYLSVYAKNISAHSCALQSYPQIEFLNEAGEVQTDIALQPEPGIILERVAIPAGEAVISTLDWNAMSTSLDPDETVALSISAAEGMAWTMLTPEYDGQLVALDILDGADLVQSPWVQARDGWASPQDALKPGSPSSTRP